MVCHRVTFLDRHCSVSVYDLPNVSILQSRPNVFESLSLLRGLNQILYLRL